jgi:hypothetical protein
MLASADLRSCRFYIVRLSASDNQIPWHGRDRGSSQLRLGLGPRRAAFDRPSGKLRLKRSAPSVAPSSPGIETSHFGVATLPTRPSCRFGPRNGISEREWKIATKPSASVGRESSRSADPHKRFAAIVVLGCRPTLEQKHACRFRPRCDVPSSAGVRAASAVRASECVVVACE